MIKYSKFNQKNILELNNILKYMLKKQFDYKTKHYSKDFTKTHLLKKIKKDISGIKSIIFKKKYNIL